MDVSIKRVGVRAGLDVCVGEGIGVLVGLGAAVGVSVGFRVAVGAAVKVALGAGGGVMDGMGVFGGRVAVGCDLGAVVGLSWAGNTPHQDPSDDQ